MLCRYKVQYFWERRCTRQSCSSKAADLDRLGVNPLSMGCAFTAANVFWKHPQGSWAGSSPGVWWFPKGLDWLTMVCTCKGFFPGCTFRRPSFWTFLSGTECLQTNWHVMVEADEWVLWESKWQKCCSNAECLVYLERGPALARS